MRRLVMTLALLVMFIWVTPAKAAEITPEAGSYSFGSTSEFAEAVEVTSQEEQGLADTGQSQAIVLIAGGVLIILSIGAIVLLRQKRLAKQ